MLSDIINTIGLIFDIAGAVVLILIVILPFKVWVQPDGDVDFDFDNKDQGIR